MTSTDRSNDDLVPAQEKLEWVTPQISLMGAERTEGSGKVLFVVELSDYGPVGCPGCMPDDGPS